MQDDKVKDKDIEKYNQFVKHSISGKQVDFIKQIVAEYYNLSMDNYNLKTRKLEIIKQKYMAIWIILQKIESGDIAKMSLAKIGSFFNGIDHATVLHAKKTIGGYLGWDRALVKEVSELISLVDHKLMVIEGKVDLLRDYNFVDLNECIVVKVSNERSMVFTGHTSEEVSIILASLNLSDKEQIAFNRTKMYLLKKKEVQKEQENNNII